MGVKPPAAAPDAALTPYAKSLIAFKAKQLCRKPGFSRSDEEDLVQDLTLCLLEKGDRYDPSRGASVDTFANRVVISKVKMILRERRRTKRAAGFKAVSLDCDRGQGTEGAAPLSQLLGGEDRARRGTSGPPDPLSALERREAVDAALASLPPDLAAVAERLRVGSANAAAAELGLSWRRTDAAVTELRRRFEAAGLKPE
jgi:RNA polymerase sigma-70 factor (ECF subfamily)